MNIANQLTVLRVFLTFGFIYLIHQSTCLQQWAAAGIFAMAAITDFLDGYLARKYNLISDFGKIADPIADKFLILSAFYVFYQFDLIAWWMIVVIFIREIGLTLLRFNAMKHKKVLAAESLGKYKTVAQIFTICIILLSGLLLSSSEGFCGPKAISGRWALNIDILMYLTVILTLVSGFSFLWNNRKELL
ncbi:CDP-diacylglycerol--glycerol-3-phosphate 3-phosphatidyltransferase [hydrothermal vent metagenome]|uniref:CDP-diacylglycerol--glycerol-3-phosphate 3-phosphatidyltransferase n=1 Tax=hydrothermal vent metagenome TaxID=652676 RepID=A0A3B0TKL2_9ZZZZ